VRKKITQDILNWSINFVEKKSNKLNDWPICPYAKQARLKDQVKIVEVKNAKDYLFTVVKEARTIQEQNKKLIIVASDDMNITIDELSCYINALNHTFVMDDVYLMPFHPDDEGEEEVEFLEGDFELENEFYMVLIQPFKELEKASSDLHKQGYYDKWNKEYYQDTVLLRQTYRRNKIWLENHQKKEQK